MVEGSGSTWTIGPFFGGLTVGNSGSGTLSITDGGSVSNLVYSGYSDCYIGNASGSTGMVTVDGSGSTLTNGGSLYVGGSGSGTLNIYNGSNVSAGDTYVGLNTGSTGTIGFGANGGTLSTQSLFAAPSQLTGIGTINARGLVSDINLVLDEIHGLTQTITLNNTSINLNMIGDSNSTYALARAGPARDPCRYMTALRSPPAMATSATIPARPARQR